MNYKLSCFVLFISISDGSQTKSNSNAVPPLGFDIMKKKKHKFR